MNTTAILQARMNSERLPGKIIENISGIPLIEHIIDRVNSAKNIDTLIVATTNTDADNELYDLLIKKKIKVFRGDESDVLDRYIQASKLTDAEIIIRLTGDNPLIDPEMLDDAVELFKVNKPDYLKYGVGMPLGTEIEVFLKEVLTQSNKYANSKIYREHVTPFIYNNPLIFKCIEHRMDSKYGHLRLTVDTLKDLTLIREIYSRLYNNNTIFNLQKVFELYDKEPKLFDINIDIKQKTL